ncbi:molybdate ABC transporter substrate-binding protein [Selenomonas sp. AE3005]|uniref:molybdate ABC transporter substrate-binding protein n=1 Tax=Selenomonas sp. AE3005 TaxID=1485543 RepID=UPI0025D7C107|nr:molybdate ABC transporter substrate-binding protein [Selenomonas sp. AE3005]
MSMLIRKFLVGLLCTLCLLGAGCAVTEKKSAADKVELQVAAAASLTDVLQEFAAAYEAEHPQVKLVFNFGSSGALQQAIENGGQADVFFSAAAGQMVRLEQAGLLLAGSRRDLLENELVLIVPRNDTSAPADFAQLADKGVPQVALGEPRSVPVGQYAEEVLRNLDLWEQVKDKAVFGTDVRQVLAWVESGNAGCGIVYATDAAHSDKVQVAAKAPAGSHKPIVYPAAVLQESRHKQEAQAFLAYLAQRQDIFTRYGFDVK